MHRKFRVPFPFALGAPTEVGPAEDQSTPNPLPLPRPARRRAPVHRGTRWPRLATVALAAGVLVVLAAGCASSPDPASSAAPPGGSLSDLVSSLYVDPQSEALAWVEAHPGDPIARLVKKRIASQPAGKWFGVWSGDITAAVSSYTTAAAHARKVPVMVAYNIPGRDCGGQSAGGQSDEQSYRRWIDGFDAGLGDHAALVILEPDALAQLDSCLNADQQRSRLGMLSYAVSKLQHGKVSVYLDAAHSNWVPAGVMAQRLRAAGIAHAQGFSLNVSNYDPTDEEEQYARDLNGALRMSKPFVVDTSRNGKGSNNDWCNPAGRMVGQEPGAGKGGELRLWLKAPGESDGNCGIGAGTTAGEFSPKLAMSLLAGSDSGES